MSTVIYSRLSVGQLFCRSFAYGNRAGNFKNKMSFFGAKEEREFGRLNEPVEEECPNIFTLQQLPRRALMGRSVRAGGGRAA